MVIVEIYNQNNLKKIRVTQDDVGIMFWNMAEERIPSYVLILNLIKGGRTKRKFD